MEFSIGSRLKHAWNAFSNNRDPTTRYVNYGSGQGYRQDRRRIYSGGDKSIVTAIKNRIALDVAAIDIRHARLDDDGRFVSEMDSALNERFTLEANCDQTPRAFIQDLVHSCLDEGFIAIVPIDIESKTDPMLSESFEIESWRVGKIVQWYPRHIRVDVYNDRTGRHEELTYPKNKVAIIENPLYSVMNEPNSIMQRLIRKLNLLDAIDEQSGSGKLDLIIQLPYVIKSDARRDQAEKRRKDIENQLSGSKYGIAYTDGTERITQLNRPVENNLMKQIEYLTNMAYSQIGMTQTILDGTADEKTMLNYYDRTVEPWVAAIVSEIKRKFLSKTARSQKQSIVSFRDPFKLVPVTELAEMADKLTRNEIATSNEIRQIMGWKPSNDPNADELRNKNLSESKVSQQLKNPNENIRNTELDTSDDGSGEG